MRGGFGKHVLLSLATALAAFPITPMVPYTFPRREPDRPKEKLFKKPKFTRRGWYIEADAESRRARRQAVFAAYHAENPMNFLPNRIATKIYGRFCRNETAMRQVAQWALDGYRRGRSAEDLANHIAYLPQTLRGQTQLPE